MPILTSRPNPRKMNKWLMDKGKKIISFLCRMNRLGNWCNGNSSRNVEWMNILDNISKTNRSKTRTLSHTIAYFNGPF